MLRHYVTTALRNLARNRLYSAINIGGLAIGLAACLLIVLFLRDELSYDRWLPNADRIAKLEITFTAPGREPLSSAQTPGLVKAPLEKDFSSDIEHVVRIFWPEQPVRVGDLRFIDRVSYVDREFFAVFDLPVIEGDREAALASTGKLAVSQRMARKYFGEGSPLGRVVTIDGKTDYTVVAVFADLPANSHLAFDVVTWLDPAQWHDRPWVAESWTSANTHAYVLFRSPQAMTRVAADLPAFVERNVALDIPGFRGIKISSLVAFDFLPLLDIHLYGTKQGHLKPGGDIRAVVAFGAVAVLILVIACINFVNLATARSMKRAREVAMRKVVGATRGQLIRQHLGEAILTAFVALLIAIAIAELAVGPFNQLLAKQLTLDLTRDPALIAIAGGLVAVVGILGGLYPALYLSRFRPATVLKANQSSATGSPKLRNALVVFQFAISIALIVSTAVIYAQTRYARSVELGFASRDLILVRGLDDLGSNALKATLRQEIGASPGVLGVTLSTDTPPLQSQNSTMVFRKPVPDDDKLLTETLGVDADFFSVYGVRPLAGRVFSRELTTDQRRIPTDVDQQATQGVVVNQTFLAKFGIATPEEAVGLTLWDLVDVEKDRLVRTTIVGVVPDLHLRSVRTEISPMLFYLRANEDPYDVLSIAVEPGRMREVHDTLEALWRRLVPSMPMRAAFLDAELAALYDADEQQARTFAAFSVLAVLIACLGLFGLASFAAERRTKEIGLRKVMGASVLDIVRLLVWQFSKPVILANLIAWPVAFYVMSRWLAGFRYAIHLGSPLVFAGVFGGAGLLALAIAWATVAGHAAKVASSSPIHALRCE